MAETPAPTTNHKDDAKASAETKKDSKLTQTLNTPHSFSDRKVWVVVVAIIVGVSMLCVAFAAGHRAGEQSDQFGAGGRTFHIQAMNDRGMSGGRAGMMHDAYGDNDDAVANTRVRGVVTAVSGDTITVAGNGTTTKVTVSDNTSYAGSSKPAAVNDTIMAVGAKDASDTLVASSVRLVRQ